MVQVSNVLLQFGSRVLFKDVNLKFTKGNCYGIIGANGAGKSTFLKIITGELEPNKGEVFISPNERMSVLAQNQNAYDEHTVLETVLLGHKRLMDIQREKDELYAKPDFNEEDGIRAGELEQEFAELGGWEADGEAKTLLSQIGIKESDYEILMSELDAKQKVKVLLAQALFGNPDILVLDEPTNHLDLESITSLNKGLINFQSELILTSRDHELNRTVTNRIIEIKEDGTIIDRYLGYDEYLESKR